ncbi:MAG: ATP-binding protein [Holophaga sp.]|nr:ATP-binding protein [Holophaga sp.]
MNSPGDGCGRRFKGWARRLRVWFPPGNPVPAEVLWEQISLVQDHIPMGMLTSALVSVAMGWVLGTPDTRRALGLWMAGSILVSGIRYLDSRAYRTLTLDPRQLARARRNLNLGALLQGMLWGLAGLFLLPSAALEQLFFISVIAGMTAGAVAILSSLWSAYALFMIPAIMPVCFRLMGGALLTQKLVGSLGLVYSFAMLFMAAQNNRLFKGFLAAAQDNQTLARHLQEANATLAESHARLETAVVERTLELCQANALLKKEIAEKQEEMSKGEARERALQDLNQRLELATVSGNLGIWDLNLMERTGYWSDRMLEIYGLPPQAGPKAYSVDFWLEHVLHPEDRPATEATIRAALEGKVPFELDFRALRPDGTVRWVHSCGHVLRDADGKALRVIGIERDRTREVEAEAERDRMQAELQHTEKLGSLGRMAGGVAHDMNNVLGAILALASANLDAQPPDSPAHRAFQIISQAAVRGGEMVKSLLSFARQNPAEERELDVNAILREEVHLLERTTLSRVLLELDLAPGLRPIRGDAGALTHAFMNLCVNAVDAMSDHGRLLLRTRNLVDGWIEVQVQDTGSGMTKAVLDRALDPFFTTKEVGKGTGLGLSMVFSTVKAHRGQMEIQSEPGRGTCVRLLFPGVAPAAQTPAAEPPGPQRQALSILLVDDDDLVQRSTQGLLEAMGHSSRIASSGEEALLELRAWRPDLVILDLNMPGLGGAETLPRLRALFPDLPVLLATGRADQTALDLVKAFPRVALLSKPFGIAELRAQLAAFGPG